MERVQTLESDLELFLSLPCTSSVSLLLGTLFNNPVILISPILIMVFFQPLGLVLTIKLGNRFKEVDRHIHSSKYVLGLSQAEASNLEKHPAR